MDWWQIILIILVAILAGLLVGGLLSYLIARLLKKPFPIKRQTTAVVEARLHSVTPAITTEVEHNRMVQLLKKPFLRKHEPTKQQAEEPVKVEAGEAIKAKETVKPETKEAVAEAPPESTASGLVAEAENNHRIASEPWSGKLLAFKIDMWDKSQDEILTLPANLREDLTQAYVDMRLANSIVWLSTELGRRSDNLDESYKRLCTNIATRLDRIMPSLKR